MIPFVFADLLEIQRDVYYGIYAAAVVVFFFGWARSTGLNLGEMMRRRWILALALGLAVAGVMALVAIRAVDAGARPEGLEFAGAIIWRGVVYGAADGLLLSAFPILVVFAAFAGTRLGDALPGKIVIGLAATIASVAMTVVYHAGYSDFRSGQMKNPAAGDVIWSMPTLVTLNPIGAPIAHIGLHVTAVVNSYDTDLFLPPHD